MIMLVGACGGNASPGGGSAPTAEVTAGPESPIAETTPPVEGTGTEAPPPTTKPRPAIELASLPVGGGSETGTSEQDQCIDVAWLGNEMPDGVSVEVTSMRISPKGVFRSGSGSLECGRSCDSYVFQEQGDDCHVAVHAQQANTDATLRVSGKVRCPAGKRQTCEAFAAGEEKNRTIGLRWEPEVPESPSPSPSPSPPDSTG